MNYSDYKRHEWYSTTDDNMQKIKREKCNDAEWWNKAFNWRCIIIHYCWYCHIPTQNVLKYVFIVLLAQENIFLSHDMRPMTSCSSSLCSLWHWHFCDETVCTLNSPNLSPNTAMQLVQDKLTAETLSPVLLEETAANVILS